MCVRLGDREGVESKQGARDTVDSVVEHCNRGGEFVWGGCGCYIA